METGIDELGIDGGFFLLELIDADLEFGLRVFAVLKTGLMEGELLFEFYGNK